MASSPLNGLVDGYEKDTVSEDGDKMVVSFKNSLALELYGACPLVKVCQRSCHDLDRGKEMMKGPLGQKVVTNEKTKKTH